MIDSKSFFFRMNFGVHFSKYNMTMFNALWKGFLNRRISFGILFIDIYMNWKYNFFKIHIEFLEIKLEIENVEWWIVNRNQMRVYSLPIHTDWELEEKKKLFQNPWNIESSSQQCCLFERMNVHSAIEWMFYQCTKVYVYL